MLSEAMLFLAGTAFGMMLGTVTYVSKSIWPGIWIHGIWNMVMIGKIFAIQHEIHVYDMLPIYTYVLDEQNILLTGGKFGIEASIISVIGYLCVTAVAVKVCRDEKVRR